MFQVSKPTFIYQRKRLHRNSVAICSIQHSSGVKLSDGSHSAINTETPSVASKEHAVSVTECATEAVRSPIMKPVECNTETLISDVDRIDNCSSSKSNLELSSASLRMDMDDAGACSCSGESIADKVPDGISERDMSISILRSQGVPLRVYTRRGRVASRSTSILIDKHHTKLWKVCECSESMSKLLICNHCGDINADVGKESDQESKGELGSLEFMFIETEPYMSSVRIGDEFQASVPDFCARVDDECDLVGEPLEMQPCYNDCMQEKSSTKPLKLSSIGNWLQCREVINPIGQGVDGGVDGTICGKWRRAPLFEVQTHNWECNCCILWDPAHADCSVPQELETAEVKKQLKYVEMLRPRLSSKRWKLHCSKRTGL